MIDLLNLGSLYVSDFLAPGESSRCPPAELRLQMDEETGAVRLKDVVDPSFMYGRYWYHSGTNESMKRDLKDVVDSITRIKKIDYDSLWLDIACNDGTLLSFVNDDACKIGIDPVEGAFHEIAKRENPMGLFVQDYFSEAAYRSVTDFQADVVTCIAMFYDLDEPLPFLKDVHSIMEDDGIFVLQMSYTPLMLEQLAFDNICHEHVYYYTAETISRLLWDAGFQIMDIQLNDTNGGSFRVYSMKKDADITKFGSQPYRDVCDMRTSGVFENEIANGYNSPDAWKVFTRRLAALKTDLVAYVKAAVAKGETVAFLGASTKGNTLAQYFGLDFNLISYAVERSPEKFGRRMVGTNVPIVSEEEMRANPPDILILLPWCFVSDILERESAFLRAGGRIVVPMPQFRVYTEADL